MMKYIYIILIMWTACAVKVDAATRRALVFGLGEYKDKAWSKIHGDADVYYVHQMLMESGFTDIRTLKNEQATKQGMVKAFIDLANRCKKGDVVYVHYSGHGQLMTDVDGDKAQLFAERMADSRTVTSKRYPDMKATIRVNQNLMDFYSTYPTSMIGDNFVTRWAMYANTPMQQSVQDELYPALRSAINGCDQLTAVNKLLNWVQTGFVYEYDDKVWGGDRAFFAEESLNYPYCDCEDRSILFTRLVRDLLGLKCILIYYPGHLACAVQFTESVNGDYITLGGRKFVVTDPTYIGAPVGKTMPDMDNQSTKVILLD